MQGITGLQYYKLYWKGLISLKSLTERQQIQSILVEKYKQTKKKKKTQSHEQHQESQIQTPTSRRGDEVMDHIINLHNSTSYDRSPASTLASIVQGTSPLVLIDGLDAIPINIRITNRRPLQTLVTNLVPRVL
ncbi:hypothetical protein L1049_001925 [Liquidambar formosana]|uniref:Uncharacterized protein n=1 Tax=Liquidambar formosana TaxID=63359 RepID=A0AAP0NIG5_LIQFO